MSKKHPHLTMNQFRPFEAVKGHKEAILKVIEDNEKNMNNRHFKGRTLTQGCALLIYAS